MRAAGIAMAGCSAAGCVEPYDGAPQTETCRTVAYAESRFGLASGPDRLEEWAFDAGEARSMRDGLARRTAPQLAQLALPRPKRS